MIKPQDGQQVSETASAVARAARAALFFLLVAALVSMPEFIVTTGLNERNGAMRPLPLYLSFAVLIPWGVFSTWVAMDAPRFLRFVKQDAEPLGAGAALLALAGLLNVIAAVLGLFMS